MGRTSRRQFIQGAGAAVALAAVPGRSTGQSRAARPNILFVLADDLGYADLSIYGRRDYRTPVLDRLAREGVLMTQAYANSAVCSPTRVALITGRYPQRLSVGLAEPIRNANEDGGGLPEGQPTLPALLRLSGYRTVLVGKWHMGWPPEHGPLRHGYERFFGIAASAADYVSHRQRERGAEQRDGLYEGDSVVHRTGYLTDLLAERAIEEVRAATSVGMPFMVSLHFTAPHWPWQRPGDPALPRDANLRHEDGGSLEIYGEMVRRMDDGIGRVLAEIDRLGVAEDTIVVFTSDNGGERFSDTWPLRGEKGDLLEGGIRVPVIVRWPATIPAGTRSGQVMATMDWLPTLVAAAGGVPDPAFPPDGENMIEALRGAGLRPRRLFWRFRRDDQAAARIGDWKYLRVGDEESLFDIARDPRERANLKNREAERFAQLKADWTDWNTQMLSYPPEAPETREAPAPG